MSEINHQATDNSHDHRDDLEDRLADQTLAELLSGQAPPDLSQPILLAAERSQHSWSRAGKMALAASLLIATGAGVWGLQWYRQRNQAENQLVANATPAATQTYERLHGLAGDVRFDEVHDISGPQFQRDTADRDYGLGSATPLSQPAARPASTDYETRTREAGDKAAPDSVRVLTQPDSSSVAASSGRPAKSPLGDHRQGLSVPPVVNNPVGALPADSYYVAPSPASRLEDLAKPSDPAGYAESAPKGIKQLERQSREIQPLAESLHSLQTTAGLDVTMREKESRIDQPLGEPAAADSGLGRGAGQGGDRYSRIVENAFLKTTDNPLSTFSIDVDTASYAKSRRYLMQNNILPPPDAVRIEEFVNYFHYDYAPPVDDKPFAAHIEVAACPWQPKHRLVRVGLKGREIARDARPASNLVFLLDVSGSMSPDDKLPRVRRSMRMLVDQLGENDRVAIAVYAGASGLVLPSTPGYRKDEIISALENLHAGGSTNGASGIRLAYDTALASFIKGATNRVILCTDGDFNVGTTSTAELERLAEEKAKSGVFLTVLGFGMGNHNDDMLEKLADKGNGNYGYIDSEEEARKLLVDELGGTLITIAKDVKIQVEFNPRTVGAYRLVGYENRMLKAEDFNDDKKDAGEIGAGHTVTALYEIVPPGEKLDGPAVDPLRYQQVVQPADAVASSELLTLKLRYKDPDGQESHAPLLFPVTDRNLQFGQASGDFKFATAVAGFAMLLRDSQYRGNVTYDAVLEIAQEGRGEDRNGYRAAFLEMVKKAKSISGK